MGKVIPLRPQRLDDAYAAALGTRRVKEAIAQARHEDALARFGAALLRVRVVRYLLGR